MHTSVNFYEMNPRVAKRQTAGTVVLPPPPTEEYCHPALLIYAAAAFSK